MKAAKLSCDHDDFRLILQFHSSDGNLKKRWKIIDGKRCLVKGGSNPFRQQPFNEVIASCIMDQLSIPHIPYQITWNRGASYSVCEDFIDENTELIPAWRIINIAKRNNSVSVYQHFVDCCERLGIQGVVPFLDQMITLDYIIANEDRHLNNFGALRNAETLEWIGMAPIYDSGSSFGYDKLPMQIRSGQEIVCKPFKNHHEEQIKLVTSFDWLDIEKLSNVREIITEVLSDEGAKEYMEDKRIKSIIDSIDRRINQLAQLIQAPIQRQGISTEDDVEQDIAEDYTPRMHM